MAKKATIKEIFYLKVDNNHYKVIEVYQSKNIEIRLTGKVERFPIVNSTLDNYLDNYKLVFRKEITDFISANKLNYALPVIQLSMNLFQGKLF
jgi:hypothetical protein